MNFKITDFGAVSSEEILQTGAIQACINKCHEVGGGQVTVPAGKYLIGSLRLYSNMTLYLETGAVLLGSKEYKDYEDFKVPTTIKYLYDNNFIKAWNLPKYYFYAMITAFEEENIKIIGEPGSVIDGRDVLDPNGEEEFRGPMGIIMSGVKNLELSGYTFINSANWSHTLDGCLNIKISNVNILAGHDGFNLHHSSDIQVENCHLETGDDCFAGYDIQNLCVNHCTLNTACNSMRIGGENIVFDTCTYLGPGHYPHISENSYYTHAIFKFYSMSGDSIRTEAKDISIRHGIIDDADRLFMYDFGKKELMQNHLPLRSLLLENVSISKLRHTSVFKGNGEKVELTLKNTQLNYESDEVFLEIDEWVALALENVYFVHSTRIKRGNHEILLHGKIDFQKL